MKSAWLAAAIAIATNSSNLNLARNPGTSVAICNVNSYVPKAKSSYHFFGFNHRWLDVFFAIDCNAFGGESEVLFIWILPPKFSMVPTSSIKLPKKRLDLQKLQVAKCPHVFSLPPLKSNFNLFQSNHNLGPAAKSVRQWLRRSLSWGVWKPNMEADHQSLHTYKNKGKASPGNGWERENKQKIHMCKYVYIDLYFCVSMFMSIHANCIHLCQHFVGTRNVKCQLFDPKSNFSQVPQLRMQSSKLFLKRIEYTKGAKSSFWECSTLFVEDTIP